MSPHARLSSALLGLVLFLPVGTGHGAPPRADHLPPHEAVRFETEDGLELHATHWRHAERAAEASPMVIALPAYGHARISYLPLVLPLSRRGISMLAVDTRGHGDSSVQNGEHLSAKVVARDPEFFADLYRDVASALRHVTEDVEAPPGRTILVGANVGASAVLDHVARDPEGVAGLVLLSPGAEFLGLDALEDAAALPEDLPVLVVESEVDRANGKSAVAKALGARATVVLAEPDPPVDDPEAAHGTRLLRTAPGVADQVADWIASVAFAPVLNGRFDAVEAASARSATTPGRETSVRVRRPTRATLHVELTWVGADPAAGHLTLTPTTGASSARAIELAEQAVAPVRLRGVQIAEFVVELSEDETAAALELRVAGSDRVPGDPIVLPRP